MALYKIVPIFCTVFVVDKNQLHLHGNKAGYKC